MTVSNRSRDAASDRLGRLRHLRDELTFALAEVEAEKAAPIATALMKCLAEIEGLESAEPAKEATALDEINARRAARSKGSGRSKGRKSG